MPVTLRQRCYLLMVSLMGAMSFYVLYPGRMSSDSHNQWRDALRGNFEDGDPPFMAWWWGVLAHLWHSPAVLLLFHLLMFWSAVYLLGRTLAEKSAWFCLCPLIWFIPPVMEMTSMLWKDTGMACSLFLACALMLKYGCEQRRPGRMASLAILCLLFYGVAVRHNALAALPPLCLWFACLQGERWKPRKTLVVALLLFAGLIGGKEVFNRSVPISTHFDMKEGVMFYDLGRVSQRLHANLFPPYLQSYYNGHFSLPAGKNDPPWSRNPQEHADIINAYLSMIANYPAAYLAHRWEFFRFMLCFGEIDGCTRNGYLPLDGLRDDSLPRQWARSYLSATVDSEWFAGGVWLLLALVTLAVNLRYCRAHPLMRQAGWLSASAIMYTLPYFFIGAANEFRFLYWLAMAGIMAALVSAAGLAVKKR